MIDINQAAIIKTIESDMVSDVRVCRGDELYPQEILIFCGAEAHRKFIEIKGQLKKDQEAQALQAGQGTTQPVQETKPEQPVACQHDWDENLVCKKCGKPMGPE